MTTAGIILMAAMMGAMFLFGGHGRGHKHKDHAAHEVTVSTAAAAAASVQPTAPAEDIKGTEHAH